MNETVNKINNEFTDAEKAAILQVFSQIKVDVVSPQAGETVTMCQSVIMKCSPAQTDK